MDACEDLVLNDASAASVSDTVRQLDVLLKNLEQVVMDAMRDVDAKKTVSQRRSSWTPCGTSTPRRR